MDKVMWTMLGGRSEYDGPFKVIKSDDNSLDFIVKDNNNIVIYDRLLLEIGEGGPCTIHQGAGTGYLILSVWLSDGGLDYCFGHVTEENFESGILNYPTYAPTIAHSFPLARIVIEEEDGTYVSTVEQMQYGEILIKPDSYSGPFAVTPYMPFMDGNELLIKKGTLFFPAEGIQPKHWPDSPVSINSSEGHNYLYISIIIKVMDTGAWEPLEIFLRHDTVIKPMKEDWSPTSNGEVQYCFNFLICELYKVTVRPNVYYWVVNQHQRGNITVTQLKELAIQNVGNGFYLYNYDKDAERHNIRSLTSEDNTVFFSYRTNGEDPEPSIDPTEIDLSARPQCMNVGIGVGVFHMWDDDSKKLAFRSLSCNDDSMVIYLQSDGTIILRSIPNLVNIGKREYELFQGPNEIKSLSTHHIQFPDNPLRIYDDCGTLYFVTRYECSITVGPCGGLRLDNDQYQPGLSDFYGVRTDGFKGWQAPTDISVVTDIRLNGKDLQMLRRNIKVVRVDDEVSWVTWHTATDCESEPES